VLSAVEHAASVVKAVNDNASIRSLRLNLVLFRPSFAERNLVQLANNLSDFQASNDFKKDVSSLAGFLKQSKNLAYLDFSHNKVWFAFFSCMTCLSIFVTIPFAD